ncbi:MAG: hypothetical protein ACRDJV_15750, partial [Actinomycetota bacterium]
VPPTESGEPEWQPARRRKRGGFGGTSEAGWAAGVPPTESGEPEGQSARRRKRGRMSQKRLVAALAGAASLPACTGGIDAGVDGGVAFIAFTIMLIVFCIAMWLAIGRED